MSDQTDGTTDGTQENKIDELVRTIHILRSPGGCPWDRKQSLSDAARHLLDEAGEVLEAALEGDADHVHEELADLLFMVCFCTEILGESQPVDLQTIAATGNEKLVRRHPHVFGDRSARTTGESQQHWNAIKAAEKRAKGIDPDAESLLTDLPASSAPLHQAYVYQEDAAAVGFDWPDTDGVWRKLDEELDELREAEQSSNRDAVSHEVGDLLFTVVNLARRLGVQPDMALRQANRRFKGRFNQVEARYGNSQEQLRAASLAELEAAWQEAKRREAREAQDR